MSGEIWKKIKDLSEDKLLTLDAMRIADLNEVQLRQLHVMQYAVAMSKLAEPGPYDELIRIMNLPEEEQEEALMTMCSALGLPEGFCICILEAIIECCDNQGGGIW